MKEKLLSNFTTLTSAEQDIMLALAITYVPIGQKRFQQLLRKSGALTPAVTKLINNTLGKKFLELGLVDLTASGWSCHRSISEPLMRIAVQKAAFFNKIAAINLNDISQYHYSFQHRNAIKNLRIFLYQGENNKFITAFEAFQRQHYNYLIDTLDWIFFNDFEQQWFDTLSDEVRLTVIQSYLMISRLELIDCSLQYRLMNEIVIHPGPYEGQFKTTYIELNLIRGDTEGLEALLENSDLLVSLELMGMLRFLQNRNEEALQYYHEAIKQTKKQTRKRNVFLTGFTGIYYCLALFKSKTPQNLLLLKNQVTIAKKQSQWNESFLLAQERLRKGVDVLQMKAKTHHRDCYILFRYHEMGYDVLFSALLLYWLNEQDQHLKKDSKCVKSLIKYCQKADLYEYRWFAAVSAHLLQRLSVTNEKIKIIAEKYNDSEFLSIIDLIPHVDPWQRALDALTQLGGTGTQIQSSQPEQSQRMVWMVSMQDQTAILSPREQKLGKNGAWTKGRVVALKRLHDNIDEFGYLTEQDRSICSQIIKNHDSYQYRYYRKEPIEWSDKALFEAVGHPNIYWSDINRFDQPVNISLEQLQLLVSEDKNQLRIALTPYPVSDNPYIVERTASGDMLLYTVQPEHYQVAEILGLEGLLVPKSAKQQVIDSIASIASLLTVQSDIGGQSSQAEVVVVDSRLHIHLQPLGEGIQIEIFVQPFTSGGPIYKPGSGGATVLAEVDGKQLQTSRDFDLENQYLEKILEACPGLYPVNDNKWLLDDAEMALEALLQLQSLDDFAVLEWPKGKAIKISKETGLSQVQFSVRKERDWFNVSGEIQIDDNKVLEMQNLMGLLSATPGRFLRLDDGEIIALTQELRQRLDDFSGLGEIHGDNLRFHPLAAQTLDSITEGMEIKASKPWLEHKQKINSASDLNPEIPSTLQGELREYQVQGYQWLVRLAYLGAGACLADDMGLGKTVQTLALILARAVDGPTLILAPTSVCNNWLEEATRFAPTLRVSYFGTGDRQKQLDEAGAFDLVVCSYGLLQTEAEKIVQKQWYTIVADEAQAIKNPHTKRSKAAMALQGDFKVVTTGTPIENHLGELWNLFNFINPGLLGSLKKFNDRFAQKIENQKDHGTQLRLKRLLQPFILRRLKNDVLTELPARTEVTLHVELSDDERNLYEALRRSAKQKMDEESPSVAGGQKHLQILAEIMKLRRVCCHPRLVLKESEINSAKLTAFEELVDELIGNRHKALVFSQFVDHLTLLRQLLDKKGIHYQYLDGSTSMSKRKKAVNAFQSGQGDLFLISLKAGGAGLNLTAADYVVHMDPWWNPAVEDQASDRAHRMGQKRPVTIYRLVAKNTIEDKIVDLHRHKRDLANSLLEGGDVSGKMSVEDMLELLREVDD